MESKSAELEDWMHVHEMLAKKGLACEGLFSSLASLVAVLKSEVLVIDTGITFCLPSSVFIWLCLIS